MDPRHQQRIKIIQNLYAYSYKTKKNNLFYKNDQFTQTIVKNLSNIDKIISQYALKFPIKKIVKTDLSILRWAIFELNFKKKLPPKVIINEAVELAKELSGERSFAFVNAVLGKVLNSSKIK